LIDNNKRCLKLYFIPDHFITVGVRTLNHAAYNNHTTVNHRLMSNEAHDDQDVVKITSQPHFPLKRGIIMKRRQRGIARTTNAVEG